MTHAAMVRLAGALSASALSFAALAVPAPAPASAPAPGVDEGHALFALHCARCHGDTAEGGANGPSLRSKVPAMSEPAFAAKVLQRTHWTMPATGAAGEDAARDAFVQGILRMPRDDHAMPAWESEPQVASGVRSLYQYLSTLPRPH